MIRPTSPTGPSDVARHYDELDAFYRKLWGEDLHHGLWEGDEDPAEAVGNLTRLVAERGAIGFGDCVCDVGCGYGGAARFFAREYGARVLGLTLSRAQRDYAAERGPDRPRVRILRKDWLDNGLPDGCFDVVVAIESASHMEDKDAFIRECRRVVRPGGRVVVAAWLAAEAPPDWQERALLVPICNEGRLPGLATESEYRRWISECGLQLTAFDDLSEGVRPTWSWCLRRTVRSLLFDVDAWAYLLDGRRTERRFAVTVGRMWLAYRVGALRYGLFTSTA